MSGKLFIAAAGSGKTTKIIDDALSTDKKALIVTFTITNEQQIISRIKKKCGVIPSNITVSTWFSFLLKDGVRPYQGYRFKDRIEGIIFVNGQQNRYVKKECNEYFVKNNKIFTDKLAECVVELNKVSRGKVIERLSKMYDVIFVDEVQDMAGYDLELLKCLIGSNIEVIMVGDPRQCTYSTHAAKKYKKYGSGKIDEFLKHECKNLNVEIDDTSLNLTYRNNELITNFANKLYPDRNKTRAYRKCENEYEGVKIIDEESVEAYLKEFNAVQLRDNRKKTVVEGYQCYNFGESKGLEFEHVIIYPTKPMWEWIINNDCKLPPQSRAKFYVAITRAKYSVVIVKKDNRPCNLPKVLI